MDSTTLPFWHRILEPLFHLDDASRHGWQKERLSVPFCIVSRCIGIVKRNYVICLEYQVVFLLDVFFGGREKNICRKKQQSSVQILKGKIFHRPASMRFAG